LYSVVPRFKSSKPRKKKASKNPEKNTNPQNPIEKTVHRPSFLLKVLADLPYPSTYDNVALQVEAYRYVKKT
jgi:hypothetical protein